MTRAGGHVAVVLLAGAASVLLAAYLFARFLADGHMTLSLLLSLLWAGVVFALCQATANFATPRRALATGMLLGVLVVGGGHYLGYRFLLQDLHYQAEVAWFRGHATRRMAADPRKHFANVATAILGRPADGGFLDALAYRAKVGVDERGGRWTQPTHRDGLAMWLGWGLQLLLFLGLPALAALIAFHLRQPAVAAEDDPHDPA